MCIDKDFNCIVPTNDYVFKRIFGHVGNENITKNLLSSILDIEIKKINLEGNTILEKDLLDDKIGILDIKVEIDNDISCDVEMQVLNQNQLIERILSIRQDGVEEGIKKGEELAKKKMVESMISKDISINDIIEITGLTKEEIESLLKKK